MKIEIGLEFTDNTDAEIDVDDISVRRLPQPNVSSRNYVAGVEIPAVQIGKVKKPLWVHTQIVNDTNVKLKVSLITPLSRDGQIAGLDLMPDDGVENVLWPTEKRRYIARFAMDGSGGNYQTQSCLWEGFEKLLGKSEVTWKSFHILGNNKVFVVFQDGSSAVIAIGPEGQVSLDGNRRLSPEQGVLLSR